MEKVQLQIVCEQEQKGATIVSSEMGGSAVLKEKRRFLEFTDRWKNRAGYCPPWNEKSGKPVYLCCFGRDVFKQSRLQSCIRPFMPAQLQNACTATKRMCTGASGAVH